MFVSSHVMYTFSRVFVPTWNKFIKFSHSEIPQCKNDKDLLSLGLQHMNFWKNITADLDSSWSWKFERAIRRIQVNEPFNEKSSFNDRSIPVYLSVYVSMYLSIHPSIHPSTHPPSPLTLKLTTAQVVETSVTVSNNSPIQDYVHLYDQTQPTFKPLFLVFDVKRSN